MDNEPSQIRQSTVEGGKDADPSKNILKSSQRKLAQFLVGSKSQVVQTGTGEPHLQYYFAGSFATGLLSQATEITDLDGTSISEGSSQQNAITKETTDKFNDCLRLIGDVDYVALDKGFPIVRDGKVIYSYDNFPDDAKPAFKTSANSPRVITVMEDISVGRDKHRVAKILIDGEEYYIESPDAQLGGKVLQILSNCNTTKSNPYSAELIDTINRDFESLIIALGRIYNRSQLLDTAYQMMLEVNRLPSSYDDGLIRHRRPKFPYDFIAVLRNSDYSPTVHTFFKDLEELDNTKEHALEPLHENDLE